MCCCVSQGRDELGDHAGGPSEEDHEQHTDYEGPDAAPARQGRPGVTERAGPPGRAAISRSSACDVAAPTETRRALYVALRLTLFRQRPERKNHSFVPHLVRTGGPPLPSAEVRGRR